MANNTSERQVRVKFDGNATDLTRASKRAERSLDKLRRSQLLTQAGVSGLTLALVGLGPAALPVLAAVTGGVLAMGSAIAGASAAGGVLGAVLIGNISAAQGPLDRLKDTWQQFLDANRGTSAQILTRIFDTLSTAIPKLQPLFDVAAKALQRFLTPIQQAVEGGGFDRLVKFLADSAAPALDDFAAIARSLAGAFGNLLRQFAPMASAMTGGLRSLVERFEEWTAQTDPNSGIQKFIAFVRDVGPQVVATFASLAAAAGNIVTALKPLGGAALTAIQGVANAVSAMPPDLLATLTAAFIGVASAIKVVTAATAAMNLVMSLNPIGLVVIAIGALIAILVVAWKRSEKFRKIVSAAFDAVKKAAQAVWNWLEQNWPLLLTILTGPIGAAVVLVVRNWDKIKAGAISMKDWIVSAWNTVIGKVRGAASSIKGFLSGIWDGVLSGARSALNGAISLINSAVGGINALIDGANKVPGVSIPSVPTIPHLARGGRALAGMAHIVGEEGPELFVPERNGRVIPNNKLGAGTGGLHVENLNVKAVGPDFSLKNIHRRLALQAAR